MDDANSMTATGRLTRGMRKRGVLGTARVAAVILFSLALVGLSHPTLTSVLCGLPLVILGASFRVWAAGHLLKSVELATDGPYRHVQHPLYFGRLCLATGFCVMATRFIDVGSVAVPLNLAALAVVWLVFFGYYLPRKQRVEGERLLRLHGKPYEEFIRAVPAIFPRVTPHGPKNRSWSAERYREINEKWMVLAVSLLTIAFAVQAWRLAG